MFSRAGVGVRDMGRKPQLIRDIGLKAPAGEPIRWMRAVAQASIYRILICLLSQPAWLRVLRGLGAARRWTPVLRAGPVSLTLSHAHTVALLEQADDFHVTAGLSDRLPAGSFLMDIDWAGQHAAEKAAVEVGLGAECGDEVKALRAFAQDQ